MAFPPPAGFTDNTTDFIGLTPGTTYFFRARAENGDGFSTAFGALWLDHDAVGARPDRLFRSSPRGFQHQLELDAMPDADSYNLYEATAPLTLVLSTPTPGFVETGLSTNTPYGLTVTAVINFVESGRSPAVSSYTFAAAPGPRYLQRGDL